MRRPWFLCVPLSFLLFIGCSNTITASHPYATFESTHFIIYFEEKYFSLQEIERFAQKKERIFDYVTHALDVRYDGIIPVYLHSFISDSVAGWASYNGTIDENRAYVLFDDGHEIIHAIVFKTLGVSHNHVLNEGLAMSLELGLENENAIQRFITEEDQPLNIAGKFLNDTLGSSALGYNSAGAFVRFLIDEWGIDTFKAFYASATGYPTHERLEGLFTGFFGTSVSSAEQMFNSKYF